MYLIGGSQFVIFDNKNVVINIDSALKSYLPNLELGCQSVLIT